MSPAAILEYSSQAPYPLVQRRLPNHLLSANGDFDYISYILKAKESFKDVIPETPLVFATSLSERLGNKIWLKREDTQVVFSFKIRGAFNCMNNLTQDKRDKGVATCSAGQYAYFYSLPPPDAFQATMHRASLSLALNSAFTPP